MILLYTNTIPSGRRQHYKTDILLVLGYFRRRSRETKKAIWA